LDENVIIVLFMDEKRSPQFSLWLVMPPVIIGSRSPITGKRVGDPMHDDPISGNCCLLPITWFCGEMCQSHDKKLFLKLCLLSLSEL
jgi:hypothetical protein